MKKATLSQLTVFEIAAKHLHFTRAAQEHGTNQPLPPVDCASAYGLLPSTTAMSSIHILPPRATDVYR